MQRDIEKTLLFWKDHPLRIPLIIRGARQVGKTFIVQSFGNKYFKNSLTINFEESNQYHTCFQTMNPQEILREIELLSKQPMIPGETLLFLDEIQQCPKALQSLRYFKEKLPQLHLIAAGSLLEFAMEEEEFSFPVGRVQFAKLYPFSFLEFLSAIGEEAIRKEITQCRLDTPLPESIHHHLLKRLQEYFIVGGMPGPFLAFLKTGSFLEAKYAQKAIWDAYERDFGKYAAKTQHRHLRKIFQTVPRLIGEHVKYSRIDPELPNPSREMKKAIELLHMAGLLHFIKATSAGSIPLLSGMKESLFKLLFLDIGLIEQAMDLQIQNPGRMAGPLAEQFVGQELLAKGDPFLETSLFFWMRDGGSAEVDYLFAYEGAVIPIEVKAGKWGKLKSMQLFLEEKKAPFGIKVSQEPLQKQKQILSVPLYLVSQLPRFIEEMLGKKK